ncbi:MAG: aspartyl-phosphate phosphatase Spo0E family protein [Firmicutes bacterium]|nr:aspartyl-phosphate phosphatase Spo0E family protein [Bacillota bacterium]
MFSIKNLVSLETLREEIEIVRGRMQQLGNEKGYTDNEVLTISIELDNLINEYQRRTAD